MPKWTLKLAENGAPVIDVVLFPSPSCLQILAGLSGSLPEAVRVKAIIDTAASITCVDRRALNRLGLVPIGTNQMLTSVDRRSVNEYDVCFMLVKSQTELQVIPSMRIAEVDLDRPEMRGVEVIIGRDGLSKWVLNYDGPAGEFTVSW